MDLNQSQKNSPKRLKLSMFWNMTLIDKFFITQLWASFLENTISDIKTIICFISQFQEKISGNERVFSLSYTKTKSDRHGYNHSDVYGGKHFQPNRPSKHISLGALSPCTSYKPKRYICYSLGFFYK